MFYLFLVYLSLALYLHVTVIQTYIYILTRLTSYTVLSNMSNRSRHDVRRQLFRGISTRISSHNHNSSSRDEHKDQMVINQSVAQQQQSQQNHHHLQQNHLQQHHQTQQPQTSDGFANAPTSTKTKRSLLKRNNIITPTLASKSNAINFTPNSTYSSSSSASASTDANTAQRTDNMIIRKDEADMNEYDYKTFSTNHPLRISKIKAFEQAEMTSRLYFSRYDDLKGIDYVDGKPSTKKNRAALSVTRSTTSLKSEKSIKQPSSDSGNGDDDEIIIQIPGMTQEETKNMFKGGSIMTGNCDPSMKMDMDCGVYHDDEDIDLDDAYSSNKDDPFLAADRRLRIMKNALKPVTEEQLVSKKLKKSELNKVFQNSGQFLRDLDLQELEFWELLNEDFEKEMETVQCEIRNKQQVGTGAMKGNGTSLLQGYHHHNNLSLLDTPLDTVYKSITPELSAMISDNLRKKIKQEINSNDFEINLN